MTVAVVMVSLLMVLGVDGAMASDQDKRLPGPVIGNLDRAGGLLVGQSFSPAASEGWVNEGRNEETNCGHFSGGSLPEGVLMMVTDGRVKRFELDGRAEKGSGPWKLHKGMSVDAASTRMPTDSRAEAHAYAPEAGFYLTWIDADRGVGIRVETYKDVVANVLWGDADAITLAEGCS